MSIVDVSCGALHRRHTSSVRVVFVAMLGVIGCGDLIGGQDGGALDASADAHASTDASSDGRDGGTCFPACPASLPNQGDSCGTYLECEYGDAAATEQNAYAQCACGWWNVYRAPPSYMTSCPGYGDGGTCADLRRRCDYPEGACMCMPSGDAGLGWACQAQLPSCPWPRPRVGGPCAPTDQCKALFEDSFAVFCDYTCCTRSDCCGGTWDLGCSSTLPSPC